MIHNKKVLALIPARGGSKGIKDKNIIELCGKPLISYSIKAGLESKYIDNVVVTTDSEKIAKVAMDYGANVPFMRPDYLASDSAKTIDAIIHALKKLEDQKFEILVILQPTQPLRTSKHIDEAISMMVENDYKSLVSICPTIDSPYLIRTIDEHNKLTNLLNESSTIRRQDMKKYYKVNGCIYINYINDINENTSFNDNEYAYIMEYKDSVDIDEYDDLIIAKTYMERLD